MRSAFNHPITLEELSFVLAKMAMEKLLGSDSVLVEFYKCLWPTIGPEYHKMLYDAISCSSFPKGVNEGLIVLLHKGGARDSLNNWRPITLLNVSYKLFAKALQKRLQPIFMEIIFHDQSAFLQMRFILENIFFTYETIHYAKQTQ